MQKKNNLNKKNKTIENFKSKCDEISKLNETQKENLTKSIEIFKKQNSSHSIEKEKKIEELKCELNKLKKIQSKKKTLKESQTQTQALQNTVSTQTTEIVRKQQDINTQTENCKAIDAVTQTIVSSTNDESNKDTNESSNKAKEDNKISKVTPVLFRSIEAATWPQYQYCVNKYLPISANQREWPDKLIVDRYMVQDEKDGPLVQMDLRDFVMTVGARSPSPGGGSVSALVAALVRTSGSLLSVYFHSDAYISLYVS